jgi:hypothetical protein
MLIRLKTKLQCWLYGPCLPHPLRNIAPPRLGLSSTSSSCPLHPPESGRQGCCDDNSGGSDATDDCHAKMLLSEEDKQMSVINIDHCRRRHLHSCLCHFCRCCRCCYDLCRQAKMSMAFVTAPLVAMVWATSNNPKRLPTYIPGVKKHFPPDFFWIPFYQNWPPGQIT